MEYKKRFSNASTDQQKAYIVAAIQDPVKKFDDKILNKYLMRGN